MIVTNARNTIDDPAIIEKRIAELLFLKADETLSKHQIIIHKSGTENDINHVLYPVTLILDGSNASNGTIPLKINIHSIINTKDVVEVIKSIFFTILYPLYFEMMYFVFIIQRAKRIAKARSRPHAEKTGQVVTSRPSPMSLHVIQTPASVGREPGWGA